MFFKKNDKVYIIGLFLFVTFTQKVFTDDKIVELSLFKYYEDIPYHLKLSDLKNYGKITKWNDGVESGNAISIRNLKVKTDFKSGPMGEWNSILSVDISNTPPSKSPFDTINIFDSLKFKSGIALNMSSEEIKEHLGTPKAIAGKSIDVSEQKGLTPGQKKKYDKMDLVFLFFNDREKPLTVDEGKLFNCAEGKIGETMSYEVEFKQNKAIRISFAHVYSDLECTRKNEVR